MRTAAQRAKWAAYMRRNRAERKERGQCRQCSEPAAYAPDGRTLAACNKHLDVDADRQKLRASRKKNP